MSSRRTRAISSGREAKSAIGLLEKAYGSADPEEAGGDVSSTIEDLAAFYLGRVVDPESGETRAEPLLYESKDLTTHALCVGMTGSGKTGLCIGLLEEAALDGIPAIVVDPKGDLGNLFLTFPKLSPEEFEPWIDPAEATRKGLTPERFAAETAKKWREGLAAWDQGPARVRRMGDPSWKPSVSSARAATSPARSSPRSSTVAYCACASPTTRSSRATSA